MEQQRPRPRLQNISLSRVTTRERSHSRARSARSTRSHPAGLHRYHSAQSFDDHCHYNQHDSPEGNDSNKKEDLPNIQTRDFVRNKTASHDDSSSSSLEGNERDPEKGARNGQSPDSDDHKDPYLITWDGPSDPANPKNWPMRRKWLATFVVSSFAFISPVSSSMVAPAMQAMKKDLNLGESEFLSAMVLSIFVLAYAVGPLFLAPLSEVYGRVRVLQLSNLVYLVWNLACGFAQTGPQMLVFRFLSGLGGSAPLAVGGAVLGDCFRAEERGRAISMYSLAPLLGPAIGPIAGGFITTGANWRWIFYAATIADALIQISGFFFLQETYAPILLKKKAAKLRKKTGKDAYYTEYDTNDSSLIDILSHAFVRPFRMLFTQPIIIAIAIYMAYLYGLMYLMLSTFPRLWTVRYGESVNIGSLNYISLGVGFFLGAQITAPINDRIYRKFSKQNNDVGKPEFRVPPMFVGSFLLPVGLFWYGWAAQAQTHWIVPNIGAAIFCAGTIICFQSMQTYIVDSYTRYAASGIAATVVLRSLAGFGFPLFAPSMFDALGYGWGNALLGFVGIVLGIPAPLVFWKYGERLRAQSKYASG